MIFTSVIFYGYLKEEFGLRVDHMNSTSSLPVHPVPSISRPQTETATRSAVSRVATILETLGSAAGPLSLSQVARRAGLPKTTAHRLLYGLVAHALVQRHDDQYSLGVAVNRLARTAQEEWLRRVRHHLLPHLVGLYERTHHTISLAVLCDLRVVYLERIYGHRHLRTPSDDTNVAPAHCTALGKVLLSSVLPAGLLRAGELEQWTPHTITNWASFEAELGRVRRDGIAYSREEYVRNLCCVAVPIRDRARRLVGAISIGGLTGCLDIQGVSADLRRTAHAMSVGLCGVPDRQ